jgi:hypothetical protein
VKHLDERVRLILVALHDGGKMLQSSVGRQTFGRTRAAGLALCVAVADSMPISRLRVSVSGDGYPVWRRPL